MKPRARDLGVPFDGNPGAWNAITDVPGVEVGHRTITRGGGPLVPGKGPVRTGVTVILPRGRRYDPVFAGWHSFNGCGDMTGTHWIDESGFMESPIAITNTHSVGVVRDAVIAWMVANHYADDSTLFSMPVVAETYDGSLNDINGFHVHKEHVFDAFAHAANGPVPEGNVGGGTGMICHQFKGGIGAASRVFEAAGTPWTLGVLVQANHGLRRTLTIAGVPVGQIFTDLAPEIRHPQPPPGSGSIIGVCATDAPLLPHQLQRLARRMPLGVGRVGGQGRNSSGDLFLAFSTANPGAAERKQVVGLRMLPNDEINPLFEAAIQATEEAIVNALVAAETMKGVNNNIVYGIPHDRLAELMSRHRSVLP